MAYEPSTDELRDWARWSRLSASPAPRSRSTGGAGNGRPIDPRGGSKCRRSSSSARRIAMKRTGERHLGWPKGSPVRSIRSSQVSFISCNQSPAMHSMRSTASSMRSDMSRWSSTLPRERALHRHGFDRASRVPRRQGVGRASHASPWDRANDAARYRGTEIFPSTIWTSPVWTPARIFKPSGCTASAICCAQRTARAGPSKDAKNPSPAVSISVPR